MLKVFVFVSQSCFLSATILQMLKVIEKELPPSTPCYTELVNRINLKLPSWYEGYIEENGLLPWVWCSTVEN